MRILFQFSVRQAANFLTCLISKWGLETTHFIHFFCSNFSKLEGEVWASHSPWHFALQARAPYPAYKSGHDLNPSANLFRIHLSFHLASREKSIALEKSVFKPEFTSSPSIKTILLWSRQNWWEVPFFASAPSSCLSFTCILYFSGISWAPLSPPIEIQPKWIFNL